MKEQVSVIILTTIRIIAEEENRCSKIYSDPQNYWYVYNIWLVIIISQQPMKLCIYFLYHIDAMHVGYTPYKYYHNPFSIQWDIIMFLPLGHINSFVADS